MDAQTFLLLAMFILNNLLYDLYVTGFMNTAIPLNRELTDAMACMFAIRTKAYMVEFYDRKDKPSKIRDHN